MSTLRDILQGASNSAASNISAPVDGLAWLLRKAGVNTGTPVLGSDWMAQKGFTAQPQNQNMGLLGEALGGIAPIMAAAKAPQIARGLLQMEANAAVPRTMNPQTGAVVWHGSPHKFDAFDSSKIGTGEGNQVYGHGLYLADSPDVANGYAKTLSMRDSGQTPAQIKAAIKNAMDTMQGPRRSQVLSGLRADLEIAKQNTRSGPQTYKVDLPDDQIAKMLDYDNPLSESMRKPLSTASLDQFGSGLTGTSGEHLYKEMVFNFKQAGHKNPTQAATDWLTQKGVPGMKYLDGGSRATGGTSNYVVFPGNERLLNILERNGKALK